MDAERLNEQLRQQGLSNYINAVGNLAQMEDKFMLDPFQALLGRGGGNALQQGQSVFGQANYGLNSGAQYLNPESGLGYISNMAANNANIAAAQAASSGSTLGGLFQGLGSLGGGYLSGKYCAIPGKCMHLSYKPRTDTSSYFGGLQCTTTLFFSHFLSPANTCLPHSWVTISSGGR